MKFRIVNIAKTTNSLGGFNTNKKLEYFHHYWNFLLSKKRKWIFINDERFESHRTLLIKIKIQLSHNTKKYPKQLPSLLIDHPYFNSNILVDSSTKCLAKISAIKTYFNSNLISSNNKVQYDNQELHGKILHKYVDELEVLIVGKKDSIYIKKLLRILIKNLKDGSNITPRWKEDVKFLINAIVMELYHFGYSLNYLKKLPDIILFPNKNEFPFTKTFVDFGIDKQKFELYKTTELASLSLETQIDSFMNLIRRPKLQGYLIFKIENFDFQNDPLEILGVTFYNPQLISKLNTDNFDLEHSQYVIEIEKYFEASVKDSDKTKYISNCNAIFKIQYRPLNWGKADNSIYQAIKKVDDALQVLRRQKFFYVGGNSRFSKVSLGTYIITNEKLEYREAPDFYEDNRFDLSFSVGSEQKKIMYNHIESTNGLANISHFHSKILAMVVLVDKYLVDPETFTFKDFWSKICEPFFPNDPKEFIEFSKRCFSVYLKSRFSSNVKIFLWEALQKRFFDGDNYFLPPDTLKYLGLNIEILKPISAKRFSRNYGKLERYLQFEFLSDILNEIRKYSQNQAIYFNEVDQWVGKILLESYAERNLEVHNNISNDLSQLKLREDCIEIANIVLLTISSKIQKRTRHLDDLKI